MAEKKNINKYLQIFPQASDIPRRCSHYLGSCRIFFKSCELIERTEIKESRKEAKQNKRSFSQEGVESKNKKAMNQQAETWGRKTERVEEDT